MTVIAKPFISPKVYSLKKKNSIYTIQSVEFSEGYPKLYLGPGLDTQFKIPLWGLFTHNYSNKSLTLNTLKVSFTVRESLIESKEGYIVILYLSGATNNSLIPKPFIFHSFESIQEKSIEVKFDDTNKKIEFHNVKLLDSGEEYFVGVKIGLEGDEVIQFSTTGFCSILIKNIDGEVIIKRKGI